MREKSASGLRRVGVRIGVVSAAVAVVLGSSLAPAVAADLGDQGTAELGSVNVQGANPSSSGPIIGCDVNELQQGTTPGVSYPGVSFGAGTTSCKKEANGDANIKVTGNKFELSLFNKSEYGKRLLRVKSFEVTCQSTENGTSTSFKLNGYSGFTLPSPVPQNHVVKIPGKRSTDAPVARLVLNKYDSKDGASSLTAMRIVLDPQDAYGAIGGTVDVGVTACAPTW